MGIINSSLGQRQFNAGENFVVDDMSDGGIPPPPSPHQPPSSAYAWEPPSQPQRMSADEAMAFRQRAIAEAQGVNREARQRLDLLLGFGRATKNVSIAESDAATVTYYLRTLKSREQKHIVALAEQADKLKSVEATFPVRNMTLAYAIYAIDNIDFDLLLGVAGHPIEDRISARLAFIDELDDHVARYLFEQHQVLVKQNLIRFQSPEDVKEVAEQIKKSSGDAGA